MTTTLTKQMEMLGKVHLNPGSEQPDKFVDCWVAPVVTDEAGNTKTLTELATFGKDIYDLLDSHGRELWEKHGYEQIAFYTVGWASPVANNGDDEIAPSEHPLRKRVAMVCLAKRGGDFGTAMFMWGNPDETEVIIQDEGQGALKDMAISIWE